MKLSKVFQKLKPSTKALTILKVYNHEVVDQGKHAAMVRCARDLNISRQYVEQIIKKFPTYLLTVDEIEYEVCRVCECEVPKTFLKYHVCRDCKEQNLRHCSKCNAVYRPEGAEERVRRQICNSCVVRAHNKWQQEHKEHRRALYGPRTEYHRQYQVAQRRKKLCKAKPVITVAFID